jgi:hypothetical protein
MVIIRELGYRKVGATWVPKMLKTAQINICAKLQQRGKKNADAFLSRIITSDDTWVHQYDTLMIRKSPELHHQLSQHKKKNSWYQLLWEKSCLGQQRNLVSGILGEMCYSQFRAVHADIKETETTNLKAFAEQENESSPPAA